MLRRHALNNAMLPIVTVTGLALGGLIGGSVAVERAFGVPGLGLALVFAVAERDWMLIQNLVLFYGVIFVLINLVVDISYGWIDPRIRYPWPAPRSWPWGVSSGPRRLAASALLLLLSVSVAAMAARLAPYDPLTANYARPANRLSAAVLGTDHLGRDVLSRIIFGARITLLVAISSVLLGDTIGYFWGVASGYRRPVRHDQPARARHASVLPRPDPRHPADGGAGGRATTVIIAIAVSRVPLRTRVIRSVVLSVKEFAYIEAARRLGATARA